MKKHYVLNDAIPEMKLFTDPVPGRFLEALIQTILSLYVGRTHDGGARVTSRGPDMRVASRLITGFALLLHELATDAHQVNVARGRRKPPALNHHRRAGRKCEFLQRLDLPAY
jgi:hypothetical protein